MVAAGEHDHNLLYFTQADLLTPDQGAGIVWENVYDVPWDLADGDADTLATLFCSESEVLKWNGTELLWECATDEQGLVSVACAPGQRLEFNGAEWICVNPSMDWSLWGNAGSAYGANYVGTSDAVSLTLAVSGTAALRLEPTTFTPNLIGGALENDVVSGAYGATIGGGGSWNEPNLIIDYFGTVGGGSGNVAGNIDLGLGNAGYATVSGGGQNTAGGTGAAIGGGVNNVAGDTYATVAGGYINQASGPMSAVGGGTLNSSSGYQSTVAGGLDNSALADHATVGGGDGNLIIAVAQRSTIAGGLDNIITGTFATIGGGQNKVVTGT